MRYPFARTEALLDRRNKLRLMISTVAAGTLLVACGGGGEPSDDDRMMPLAAGAASVACGARVNNTVEKLLECVTREGVRRHQTALQAIADANNGTRASATPGYERSVEYAEQVFRDAGYKVTRQAFEFEAAVNLQPPLLEQVAPAPIAAFANAPMTFTGNGDVTAPVSAPPGDFRGCTASDFAGFPAGHIALISRGAPAGFPVPCTFGLKAQNALAAGAVGVVIYNNTTGALNGTLGSTVSPTLPVTGVTQAIGQQLAVTPGLVMRLRIDIFRGTAATYNVIAESVGGDPDNVVMAGAHLDSVDAGPGINDNGSGTAAILETAVQMAKVMPRNKLRFALWGAEESGLLGSNHYVASLSDDERSRIALYLNFDMIGSPNHVYFIYDGDDSDAVGSGPGPGGSAEIEQVFESFFAQRGIPSKGTDFSGRSDYRAFILAGIPSGGLFTGAEGVKSAQEAVLWGGTAGIAYDPCYHQACDTLANVNEDALSVNADAVAYTTLAFAMNTELVNGRRGKGNFRPEKLLPVHADDDGHDHGPKAAD